MSLTSQNTSDGYLGHFASLSALSVDHPAALYPGRRATVEFSPGVATVVYSDGISWQRSASTSFTDARTDAGIGIGYNGDWWLTYAPASAPQQSIVLGQTTKFSYNSTQSNSGVGHCVAGLNWYEQNATGNPSLAIANENKFDNNAAGTISNAKFVENQLSTNNGTISTLTGTNNRIVTNAGTVTLFVAYTLDVTANAGAVGTVYGYQFPDLTSITGINAKYAFINSDANAPVVSAAPIVDQSITYSSPSATGFTVNVPTRKQILLLTPSAGYAAGTINFPAKATLLDGQTLEVTTSQAVTAVTWGANGAAFVLNGPAGLTAGQTVRFRYFAAIDWWVRV